MVDSINAFAADVTRVAARWARGQSWAAGRGARRAALEGSSTDNVNLHGPKLTTHVRGISMVVTAVANVDLSPKLRWTAKGRGGGVAETINAMTDTPFHYGRPGKRVAARGTRESGGQAKVPKRPNLRAE